SFTYNANDGVTNSATATVTIRVFDYLRLTQLSPARHSATAASNAPIQLTFNAALDAATVSNRIVVHGAFSGRHALTTSVTGNVVTVQPTSAFKPGELVNVSVLAGIRSTGLSQLEDNFTWQFTTRAPRGGALFTQITPNTNALAAFSIAL